MGQVVTSPRPSLTALSVKKWRSEDWALNLNPEKGDTINLKKPHSIIILITMALAELIASGSEIMSIVSALEAQLDMR